MKTILLALLFALIYLQACTTDAVITSSNRRIWQEDSLACLGKRRIIYDKVLSEKERFIGESEEKIRHIFGMPNITQISDSAKRYYYFVERGPQCLYVTKKGYDTLEVEVMFVFFDKQNKVWRIGGMKP